MMSSKWLITKGYCLSELPDARCLYLYVLSQKEPLEADMLKSETKTQDVGGGAKI